MNTNNKVIATPSTPLLGRDENRNNPAAGSIQDKVHSAVGSALLCCCDTMNLLVCGFDSRVGSCTVSAIGSACISSIFWAPGFAMIAEGEGNVKTAGKVMTLAGIVIFSGLFIVGYRLHRECIYRSSLPYLYDEEEPAESGCSCLN